MQPARRAQLGSNHPLPEQGILVVRAFFWVMKGWNRLRTRTVLYVGKKGGSMMVRGGLDRPVVRSKTAEGVKPGLFLPEYMGNPYGSSSLVGGPKAILKSRA
jgi:hypothetical protein